jgi:hypothetical protein
MAPGSVKITKGSPILPASAPPNFEDNKFHRINIIDLKNIKFTMLTS